MFYFSRALCLPLSASALAHPLHIRVYSLSLDRHKTRCVATTSKGMGQTDIALSLTLAWLPSLLCPPTFICSVATLPTTTITSGSIVDAVVDNLCRIKKVRIVLRAIDLAYFEKTIRLRRKDGNRGFRWKSVIPSYNVILVDFYAFMTNRKMQKRTEYV